MITNLRVYVAGPMFSAGGNFNFPLFDYVSEKLRKGGCEVFNPADLARKQLGPLEVIQKLDKKDLVAQARHALKEELCWICDNADVLFLLPGWQRSPGATVERALALAIGVEVREADNIIFNEFVDFAAKQA
jgi:hypothetical protein